MREPTREELEAAEERRRALRAQIASIESGGPREPLPRKLFERAIDPASIGDIVSRVMSRSAAPPTQAPGAERRAGDQEGGDVRRVETGEVARLIHAVRDALGCRIGVQTVAELIREVGADEVRRQLAWWPRRPAREREWARSAASAFVAFCRQHEGAPAELVAAGVDGQREAERRATEALRAAYDAWVSRGADRVLASMEPEDVEALKATARASLGVLWRGDDSVAFRAALRVEVLRARKGPSFEEWCARRQQGAGKRGAA
jgi:hypothetical protein